jgi:HKD family nuclease
MKLIYNEKDNNHSSLICGLINNSYKIMICSGHFKKDILELQLSPLKFALDKNIGIEIMSNRENTKPNTINEIKQYPSISLFVTPKRSRYLHSKIYYFEHENNFTALIGSANLTKGALSTNEELSVQIEGKLNSPQHEEVLNYFRRLNSVFMCKETKRVPFKSLL